VYGAAEGPHGPDPARVPQVEPRIAEQHGVR
jgi:hypothetical protein